MSSQTIYIFEENGSCTNESSFTVTINTTPIVDILNDVTACDSFTLTTLTTGNYFTSSNGMGAQLNAGDNITLNQTVFIYSENSTCIDESSFNVSIYPSMNFDLSLANVIINEQDITVSMSDVSINYHFSVDDSSFQTHNQFFDLAEGIHTLYVTDENECVIRSIPFEINVTKFIIPHYFTPNGDNINEYWQILDTKNTIKFIQIFDRYGKLLKQIAPQSNGWDGTFNGTLLPTNDYWYVITLHTRKQISGHFALKR